MTDGHQGASRLVFAHLYRLRDAGGTAVAVFDAEQLYVGAPAEREAARDGDDHPGRDLPAQRPRPPPVAAARRGLPDRRRLGRPGGLRLWPDLPASLPVRDTTYWLVIDGGEITAMVWQGY